MIPYAYSEDAGGGLFAWDGGLGVRDDDRQSNWWQGGAGATVVRPAATGGETGALRKSRFAFLSFLLSSSPGEKQWGMVEGDGGGVVHCYTKERLAWCTLV